MNREIANKKKSETINSALVETFSVAEFGKFAPFNWSLPGDLAELYAADYAAVLACLVCGLIGNLLLLTRQKPRRKHFARCGATARYIARRSMP